MATSPLVGPTDVDLMLLRLQDRLNVLEQTAVLAPGIVAWCATVCPDGWLVCDGSTISAARYGQLVARLGGPTLPDIRGRVIVGLAASGTFISMLATGGVEVVTLTAAQSGQPGGTISGTTGGDSPDHTHTVGVSGSAGGTVPAAPGNGSLATSYSTSGRSNVHSHSFSATLGAASAASSHTNMPPYIVLLPIIKF